MSNLPTSFCIDIKAEKEHKRLQEFKDWFLKECQSDSKLWHLRFYGKIDLLNTAYDVSFGELLTLDRFFELLDPKQETPEPITSINVGDEFVCVEDVVSDDPIVTHYKKAEIYKSEIKGCITDKNDVKSHEWISDDDFENEDFEPTHTKLNRHFVRHNPQPKEEVKDNLGKVDVSESDNGLRYNDGKLRWSLVDFQSLEDLVKVLGFGASKYSDHNWKKGLKTTEIFESMMRHMTAYISGEDNDQESGLSHIGHVMCNAMFLSYMQREKPEFDNRILKQIQKNK